MMMVNERTGIVEKQASIFPQLTDELLDNFRKVGDPEIDPVVLNLFEQGKMELLYALFSKIQTNQDLQKKKLPDEFRARTSKYHLSPDWMEPALIEKGQALFNEYTQEILGLLGALSLPYCYAAARGAKVLYLSEKIKKNPQKRLLDTTLFVIEVMKSGAFENKGSGWAAVFKIRLRHSMVRYYISRHPDWNGIDEIPVNQEDQAGTNLAFSYIVLMGLNKLGFRIGQEEKVAFLHLWNVIAYGMGTKEELLPSSLKEAFWLEQKIRLRQFEASPEGQELTQLLVEHYKNSIPDIKMKALIVPQMRYLIGEEVGNIIGLRSGSLQKWVFGGINTVMVTRNLIREHHSTYHQAMHEFTKMRKKAEAAVE